MNKLRRRTLSCRNGKHTDATTPRDASEAHGFAINLLDYIHLSAPHSTSL